MSAPVLLAFLWLILANVIAMFPSKHHHWPAAYVLITFGLPILGWVFWTDGWIIGLIITVAAMSILRWPVRYLIRWCRTLVMRKVER
ncbi:DUF2484 family protein [Rhodobacteraceae bacterium]|nr:DUF2484 family protein [Paracoccaceae bacterium]